MPTTTATMRMTNIHNPICLLEAAARAMEPPASTLMSTETSTTHTMNTATVASQIFTKSMYTGFQRPCSAPNCARSTSRLL